MVKNMEAKITVEQMREARKSANVAFTKFAEDHNRFPSYVFCFFEGEDAKYYLERIRRFISDNVISYIPGNKKEVLKIWRRICGDTLYKDITKLFFIDRDVDPPLSDANECLYETPCYSIENLYVNRQTFSRILNAEFGISISEPIYQKCITDFQSRLNDFIQNMLDFNALVLIRRKKSDSNSNICFNDYKTRHLCISRMAGIERSEKYNEIIQEIMDKLGISMDDLKEIRQEIRLKGDCLNNFRGKNQLDFLVDILNDLKKLNCEGKYFPERLTCIHLNITKNRLSELSQYAETPPCLCAFLQRHSPGPQKSG